MEFSLANLQPKERASFALRALYEAAGCRKYHMGRFEEYGLYQENRSFLSSEQVITFTDLDGRLLALKPDVTLSIAKTAQPAPGETLRYYYHENVYRPSAESHTFKEISQMGLEMLGAVGEAQVQQAVCLAAQSLAALGAEWVLEVSHMGYLFGLFDALGVPDAARAKLLEKLREKNAHELRAAALAAGLSDTPVTLAAKSLLRVGCPVVVGVSTNDGLGASGENMARLFQRKHYYFVPYGQDDPAAKPQSLKADFALLPAALEAALAGRQIQPLLRERIGA